MMSKRVVAPQYRIRSPEGSHELSIIRGFDDPEEFSVAEIDRMWGHHKAVFALAEDPALSPYQRIIGYSVIRCRSNRLEVVRVCVKPTYRRRGIATLLLKRAGTQGMSSSCGQSVAMVSDRRLDLHNLLSGAGFRCTEIREDYFAAGHHAYRFVAARKPESD